MPWDDPTPDTPKTLEDFRYEGRRKIAIGSFYFMIVATAVMLLYGMFWPGGPATLMAMNALIYTLYGSFVTIVMAYLGVDAFEMHTISKKDADAKDSAA